MGQSQRKPVVKEKASVKRNPSVAVSVDTIKRPAVVETPATSNGLTPVWSFSFIHAKEDWTFSGQEFTSDVLPKLKDFETMTWQEIISQSGGRSDGTNSHPIPFEDLTNDAKKKLERRQLVYDEVFSLRLTGLKRIIGIREGRVLRIIWYCSQHQACKSNKKGT